MTALSVAEARSMPAKLMDKTAETHEPVLITGKKSNAVLVSEGGRKAVAETLHLLSVDGMKEPADKCSKGLDW